MKELGCWKKVLLNDLEYVASEVCELTDRPACIVLSGPVGAGKTTFIQQFSNYLMGSKTSTLDEGSSQITSPTYSLINEEGKVAHADFYRLDSTQELIHLELPLYAENKDYFLIEWGMDFIEQIMKELEDDFCFYELRVAVNETKEGIAPSRNIFLFELT